MHITAMSRCLCFDPSVPLAPTVTADMLLEAAHATLDRACDDGRHQSVFGELFNTDQ